MRDVCSKYRVKQVSERSYPANFVEKIDEFINLPTGFGKSLTYQALPLVPFQLYHSSLLADHDTKTDRLLAYSNKRERKSRLSLADVRGMRDEQNQTPQDVCGEATDPSERMKLVSSSKMCLLQPNSMIQTRRRFLITP